MESVVINQAGEIVCGSAGSQEFFAAESVARGRHVLDRLCPGLRESVQIVLDRLAAPENAPATAQGVLRDGGSVQPISITAQPMVEFGPTTSGPTTSGSGRAGRMTVILFQKLSSPVDDANLRLSRQRRRQRGTPPSDADELCEVDGPVVADRVESEHFLRRVLDSLFTFAAVCTPEGTLIEINRAALNACGMDLDRVIGRPFAEASWWSYDSGVKQQLSDAMGRAANGETVRYDVDIQVSDGEFMTIDFQIVPMRDAGGQVTHLIPSAIDITERIKAENNLILARELADSANRSKTEFLANMSHEIRTPMAAILGYADLLLESMKKRDHRKLVSTIRSNGYYLLDIINDILDLSKIEAGRLGIRKQEVLLRPLIREVTTLMKVRADEKDVRLAVEFEPHLPATIQTDPLRLKQVLINLVGNAIKFTERGRVQLRAGFSAETGKVRFDVHDTGIGIAKERQQDIFAPFAQVDSSDTRSVGGAGLGLTISRRIVERLGGRITMVSEMGKGSTFTATIDAGSVGPPVRPSADAERSVDDGGDGQATQVEWLRPAPHSESLPPTAHASVEDVRLDCRVMIVDDRREIRFLAKRFLESAGASVVTTADGQEAFNAITEVEATDDAIDLVITDIQMPRMDGYELTRRLRETGYRRPIIALTAHAMPKDLAKCLTVGCDAYSSKPLERTNFLHLVYRFAHQLTIEEVELARCHSTRQAQRLKRHSHRGDSRSTTIYDGPQSPE